MISCAAIGSSGCEAVGGNGAVVLSEEMICVLSGLAGIHFAGGDAGKKHQKFGSKNIRGTYDVFLVIGAERLKFSQAPGET